MLIRELAKELNVSTKDISSKLRELGIKVKSSTTSVDMRIAEKLRKTFASKKVKPAVKPKKPVAKVAKNKKKPVKTKKAAVVKTKPVEKIKTKVVSPKKEAIKEEKKEAAKEVKKSEIAVQKPVKKEEEPPKPSKEETPPEEFEVPSPTPVKEEILRELEVGFPISVKELSEKMRVPPNIVIKKLISEFGLFVNINQVLDEDSATKLATSFGFNLKKILTSEDSIVETEEKPEDLVARSPIVTFMGHVDHGKTSLLDAIRKTKIADYEHGAITQHIGAYEVNMSSHAKEGQSKKITFLDTPGHEAFTAMRARGAVATDIVVLVVAADDGIMPQTIEALDHAKDAKVSIIVAINKIDKQGVDIDRVKTQFGKLGLKAEDWGGKTIMVGVSAKTNQGIDELLGMILLESEMLELKANPNCSAQGIVVEAKLSKARGAVATLLVKTGSLHQNEFIVAGNYYGKIKAMFSDHGQAIKKAGPSTPVEITGLLGVPEAGEQFFIVADEQQARKIVVARQEKERAKKLSPMRRISLDEVSSQIKEGKIKELKLIIKADVQGSLEALEDSLGKLQTKEVSVLIVHTGIGTINRSDIMLASVSGAIIIGFHVGADAQAQELSKREGIDIRMYRLIYEAIEEIKATLEGLLEPKIKKIFLGKALVRKVFNVTKGGIIAGSIVQKGIITRKSFVGLLRNGQVIYEGNITSLKRFKDDVREVPENTECGISLSFDDVKIGDIIEAYEIEKIARKL